MRKFIFILMLFVLIFLPTFVFAQFNSSRVSYDVEYKFKSATPDTVIKIDSTGSVSIVASWDAVSAFDITGAIIDYDRSSGWKNIKRDYKETTIEEIVEIRNGVYSFRVWSKYAHESGNVMSSTAPSPEYFVEFRLTERAPQRVKLKMRFDSN